MHALIKNTVLLEHVNHHLSLQQVIFLLVEGLALIWMITDEGMVAGDGGDCGNFLKEYNSEVCHLN